MQLMCQTISLHFSSKPADFSLDYAKIVSIMRIFTKLMPWYSHLLLLNVTHYINELENNEN